MSRARPPRTRTEAQRRADRIRAFQADLAEAQEAGALDLTPEQRARLGAYYAAAITIGIRRTWPEVTAVGAGFFLVFLLVKFVDWWWDWMPKYLFFLLLRRQKSDLEVSAGSRRPRLTRRSMDGARGSVAGV